METFDKKYAVTTEDALSDLLLGMVKDVPAKYTTPPTQSGGYIEMKELNGSYILVFRSRDGSTGMAVQMSAPWKKVFDDMLATEPGAKDHVVELIHYQASLALDYQSIFLAPAPLPEMPKVAPMISNGTDGYVAGINHRLVKAAINGEVVFNANSCYDSRDVTIDRTAEGYFIGSLRDEEKRGKTGTGLQVITYISPEVYADLNAKYGSGCDRKEVTFAEEQTILEAAIAVIEQEAAKTHPVTPHDTIPNEVFWKQSCVLW